MRQLAALIFGIALLGGGCAWRAETRPTSFAERFSVSLGERIDVGDEPLSIGFKSVVQDSRCASDVVCIRAGEAVVQMTLSRPDQQEQNSPCHAAIVPARTPCYSRHRRLPHRITRS